MRFDARITPPKVYSLENFGDDKITVTNKMLLRSGRPCIPIMGEMQFSRVPREKWREELFKMKEGGIEVIASYVVWLHHEEEKGHFDFTGNRDLRAYIMLCHELGLEFCLRPGPWVHGECRRGGFPDWLVEECGKKTRCNEEPYLSYARRYYEEVARQVRGLRLFAVQIDNELKNQPEHLELLRKWAIELGMNAPVMTATGWGKAELPQTLLPIFGGYPEAPWEQHTRPLSENPNFFFSYQWDDGNIATDLSGVTPTNTLKYRNKFPYLTCELGGGNQVTYHRRPLIRAKEIRSVTLGKIGSGANLIGYYVYHGGLNPLMKMTTQESRKTGYPNDCPVISYDFEAPIGDQGQLRESYFCQRTIHSFIRSFGELLAPMDPLMPIEMPPSVTDTQTLRCALRTDGHGGFLFVNNYERLKQLPDHMGTHFEIVFNDRTVEFTLDVTSAAAFVLPVGLRLAGLDISVATAFPTELGNDRIVFERIKGILPKIILESGQEFVLEPGENTIGHTKIKLVEPHEYTPDKCYPIEVFESENVLSADLLLGHLGIRDETYEYTVKWNGNAKYLVIEAIGNLAGFYVDGKLLSDFYLYGDRWVIDLRGLTTQEGRIKIQPLTEEERKKIYFECDMPLGVHAPKVFAFDGDVINV